MVAMDFEDILKTVGDYGYYQKRLTYGFYIPVILVLPWFSMNIIFLTSTPDHWCYIPELSNSNLSQAEKFLLTRPKGDPSCTTYDVNYTAVLKSGNWTPSEVWTTKPCTAGWEYDTSTYDATASTRWNMVCSNSHYSSLVISLLFAGDILGMLLIGYFPDKFGRKTSFLIFSAVTSITEISSVLIPNFVAFLVLRTINGATLTTYYVVIYITMLEVVGTGKRTMMNAILNGGWTFGMCSLALVAWLTRNWIYLSATSSTVAFSLLLYWKFLPESPRWLLSQDRYDEAYEIMLKISKANGRKIQEPEMMQQLKVIANKEKEEKEGANKYSPLDVFKYPRMRRNFFLITLSIVGNGIAYFGLQINVKNLFGNEFVNFFLISIVEIPSYVVTWYLMERFGRRWCSVGALSMGCAACLIPALVVPSAIGIAGIIASVFAKLGTSAAYMTLFQQCPELYPTPLRGTGLTMSSTITSSATLSVPYIAYLAIYGKQFPFLVFSSTTFIAAVCASFLPETHNRKLPQTITDAENFGKEEKYFSCMSRQSQPDEKNIGNNSENSTSLQEPVTTQQTTNGKF